MKKGLFFFAIMAISFSLLSPLIAENLVGYRVSTSCNDDWDIAVNGTTIVRHRPTGFGRSLYSGSVNRAVSNGWNTISLRKTQDERQMPDPENCVSLDIDYLPNYTGQRDLENVVSVLKYCGSSTTNLLFNIDGSISKIVGGSMRNSESSPLTESGYFYSALALYFLFINVYGFIMVSNDRQAAKKRMPRIPTEHFVRNAIFGGGFGTLLNVSVRKHDMDKTISVVVIPAVIILQFGLLAFALSPTGRQFIDRNSPRMPVIHGGHVFDKSSDFLKSLRHTDPDLSK